ncbi:hypothetical protein HK405_000647 [Cladochytrium tenue]|nr:hypothetical protein HK405_000647 [Cladochytrium tenue]
MRSITDYFKPAAAAAAGEADRPTTPRPPLAHHGDSDPPAGHSPPAETGPAFATRCRTRTTSGSAAVKPQSPEPTIQNASPSPKFAVVLGSDIDDDDDDNELALDPSELLFVSGKQIEKEDEPESAAPAVRHSTRARRAVVPFVACASSATSRSRKRLLQAEDEPESSLLLSGLAEKSKLLASLLTEKRARDATNRAASELIGRVELEDRKEEEESADKIVARLGGAIKSAVASDDADHLASIVKDELKRGPATRICLFFARKRSKPMPRAVFEEALANYGLDPRIIEPQQCQTSTSAVTAGGSEPNHPTRGLARFARDAADPVFVHAPPRNNLMSAVEVFATAVCDVPDSYPPDTVAWLVAVLATLCLDARVPTRALVPAVRRLALRLDLPSSAIVPRSTPSAPAPQPQPPAAAWATAVACLSGLVGQDPLAQARLLSDGDSLLLAAAAAGRQSQAVDVIVELRRRIAAWWIRCGGPGGGFRTDCLADTADVPAVPTLLEWSSSFDWESELRAAAAIAAAYRVPPAGTDHDRLAARVRVLAAAVGSAAVVRTHPGPCAAVSRALARLHAAVSDTRALCIERTLAKSGIHHACMWIDLSLPTQLQRPLFSIDDDSSGGDKPRARLPGLDALWTPPPESGVSCDLPA